MLDRGRPLLRNDLRWPCAEAEGDPALAEFVTFWRDAHEDGREDGRLPRRARLDPLALPPRSLGWYILSEREGPRRYRYRLFGTRVAELIGHDLTGRPLDSATMDGSLQPFLDMLEAVVAGEGPVFLCGSIWWEDREFIHFHQVTVPFADETGAPRFVCTYLRRSGDR